jgi:hypothetical protein
MADEYQVGESIREFSWLRLHEAAINIRLSILIGIAFAAIFSIGSVYIVGWSHLQTDYISIALVTSADIFGIALIAIAAFDARERVTARRLLALRLVDFTFQDFEMLRDMVRRGEGIHLPFPALFVKENNAFNSQYQKATLFAWVPLIEFLQSMPYGKLAQAAVLQRSPAGRSRYLELAINIARTRRRGSDFSTDKSHVSG